MGDDADGDDSSDQAEQEYVYRNDKHDVPPEGRDQAREI